MEKGKLLDASILRQPYGYDYLQRYTTFACGGEKERIALEDRLEWLSSDPLKAEMILWEMEKCRKYEDYIKLLDIYGNYLTTVNHQQRLDAVSAKLYKGAAGKLASMHQKRTKQLQTMKTTANNNTLINHCNKAVFFALVWMLFSFHTFTL